MIACCLALIIIIHKKKHKWKYEQRWIPSKEISFYQSVLQSRKNHLNIANLNGSKQSNCNSIILHVYRNLVRRKCKWGIRMQPKQIFSSLFHIRFNWNLFSCVNSFLCDIEYSVVHVQLLKLISFICSRDTMNEVQLALAKLIQFHRKRRKKKQEIEFFHFTCLFIWCPCWKEILFSN